MPIDKKIKFAYPVTDIFQADKQWTYGREPVLRKMPDGTLVCLIYSGGPREPSNENVALISRSSDDGRTWSKPEIMFKHLRRAVWPTELFTEGDKPFAFIHTFDTPSVYTELRALQTFTEDNGKTWSSPVSPRGVPPNFSVRQGKVLSDGTWLFPVYWLETLGEWGEPWGGKWFYRSGVIRSSDKGGTFALSGYLHTDANLWEPEFVELEPGHLLMFLRCCGAGVLWRSESFDYGATWTYAKPSAIPNGGTKFVMFKIDGEIVLVNNTDSVPWQRRHLELWVSGDACRSWGKKILLARLPDEIPNVNADEKFGELPFICYPHGFADHERKELCLALDAIDRFYFMRVPFADFMN